MMVRLEKRDVWIDSLSAMKTSLENTYEFKTVVQEETRLIEGFKDVNRDYIVFSDYRRNDGRKRIDDIKRLIDGALEKISCCDSKETSRLYLETLKAVLMQTRWASILETLVECQHVNGF
jgi:hypothetical protein